MFYVYGLKGSDEPNYFYIGKSFVGSRRLYEHLTDAKTNNTLKANKIRSVLKRGQIVEEVVLFETDDEKEALEFEQHLIRHFGRRDIGTGTLTNHTDGGEGVSGAVMSEEARERMRRAKIGNKLNVGRPRPDMRERFSKPVSMFATDGTIIGTFYSAREASAITGVHFSQISACCSGKIQRTRCGSDWVMFRLGTYITDEAPLKRTTKKSRPILQFTKDGSFVARFENSVEASRLTGVPDTTIRKTAHGEQNSSGGYVWRFEDEARDASQDTFKGFLNNDQPLQSVDQYG